MGEELYSSDDVRRYLSTTYNLQECNHYMKRIDEMITHPPKHHQTEELIKRLRSLREAQLSSLEHYLREYEKIPSSLTGQLSINPEKLKIIYELDLD